MKGRIEVEGLNQLRRVLNRIDKEATSEFKQANNAAGELVAKEAQRNIPVLTGKARKSVRSAKQARYAVVRAGGARVPYFPWLEFGGRVGIKNSIVRPKVKGGRYLFPAVARKRDEVVRLYEEALRRILERFS